MERTHLALLEERTRGAIQPGSLAGAASTADRSDEAGVQILNMLMMYRMKQIVKTVNPAMI